MGLTTLLEKVQKLLPTTSKEREILFFLGAIRPNSHFQLPVNHQHSALWADSLGALHKRAGDPQCISLPLLIVPRATSQRAQAGMAALTVVFDVAGLLKHGRCTMTIPYVYRRVRQTYGYQNNILEWVCLTDFLPARVHDEKAEERQVRIVNPGS